jgi:predicted  nucleic acid-binding Zn-ribbon protein
MKAAVEAKKTEVSTIPNTLFTKSLLVSPKKTGLTWQIAECSRRIAALRQVLDCDNIDNEQEVIDLKARNLTLIQMKNSELGDLRERRQKHSDKLHKLLEQSDRTREARREAMENMICTTSPTKRRIQALRHRQTELNLMIGQVQDGIAQEELAERSNRKMRERLRSRFQPH